LLEYSQQQFRLKEKSLKMPYEYQENRFFLISAS